jgi:hypothetical protein
MSTDDQLVLFSQLNEDVKAGAKVDGRLMRYLQTFYEDTQKRVQFADATISALATLQNQLADSDTGLMNALGNTIAGRQARTAEFDELLEGADNAHDSFRASTSSLDSGIEWLNSIAAGTAV